MYYAARSRPKSHVLAEQKLRKISIKQRRIAAASKLA